MITKNRKPIVLLYDPSRPFVREKWEAEFPFLFLPDYEY